MRVTPRPPPLLLSPPPRGKGLHRPGFPFLFPAPRLFGNLLLVPSFFFFFPIVSTSLVGQWTSQVSSKPWAPDSRNGMHVIIHLELSPKKVKSVLQRKKKIHEVLQEAESWVK